MALENTIKDLAEARYEQGFQQGLDLGKSIEVIRILNEIISWQEPHKGYLSIPFKDITEIVHPSHD